VNEQKWGRRNVRFQAISHRISKTVRDRAKVAIDHISQISAFKRHENHRPWMTLKGHYPLCYANRAVLWLNGTS